MKRICFYFLSLIMIIGLLTACSINPSQGNAGGQAPAVISIWYSLQGKAEQELLRQFAIINDKYSEVVVKSVKVPVNVFVEKAYNLQAGGQGPEIFIADRDLLISLYEKGAISPVIADTSKVYPTALSAFTFNHQPFAVPWVADVPMLYFRKDLVVNPPVNVDQIFNKESIAVKSLDLKLLSPWWKAEGGSLSQENLPALDSPTNSAFLTKVLSLKAENKLIIDTQAVERFSTGDYKYLLAWASDSIALDQAKANWGCISLSTLLGDKAKVLLTNTIGIANSSIKTVPQLESAIRLVEEELVKPDPEASIQKVTGYLPTNINYYEDGISDKIKGEAAITLNNAWALEGYAIDWKLLPYLNQAWQNVAAGSDVNRELKKAQESALAVK